MEDWNVSTPIQINVSGHDAATLGGLPGSFYLNATNLTGTIDTARIAGLDWSKITTGKPTTLAGYGISDAYTKAEINTSLSGKQNFNNELTALSSLPDTAGFIRKTGDGTYTIDANSYLTNNQAIFVTFLGYIGSEVGHYRFDSYLYSKRFMSLNLYGSTNSSGYRFQSDGWGCVFEQLESSGDVRLRVSNNTGIAGAQAALVSLGVYTPASSLFSLGSALFISSNTVSTSTTTGALTVNGGIGADHMVANLFNGHHQLKTYTTATRPTPSSGTLGQIWLNTTTGKIEYVATSSTIQTITSA